MEDIEDDNLIKLSPYLGKSKTLMEYFFIIGYKEQNLLENCPSLLDNEENLELVIISSIETDSKIQNIDFDDIIERVYPNKPKIIKIKNKGDQKPEETNIVFSSCFNFNDVSKKVQKIFYSCYALRFYEKFTDNSSDTEYYIPKAFLIFSQYPYFSTFSRICKVLYKINIEEKEKMHKSKAKDKLKFEYYVNDNIPLELFLHCFVNYIPSPLNNNIVFDLFANEEKIVIPRLTGYPHIDFDLYKVLNIVSINDLVKIYILMLLELPLLFFSSNLEKLNIFLYSLYALNYPLTDSLYFWHLKTIPKKKMKDGLGVFTTFLGVNDNFDDNINLSNFKEVNFIIDIENKGIIDLKNRTKESEEIKKLLDYIDVILNNNKKSKPSFLNNCINLLKHNFENIKNIYKKKIKDSSTSYFSMNDGVSVVNNKIQEAFYDLMIYILGILYQDFKIDTSCTSIVNIKDRKANFIEEENIFIKYIKFCDKYSNHFFNFIKKFETYDEFKISLLFCNDFVHLRKYDTKNEIPTKISYFKIIDSLYSSTSGIINIPYDKLFSDFKESSAKNLFLSVKKNNKNQLFTLDKDIVNLFLFFKRNKKNLFKSLKQRDKLNNEIKSVNKNLVSKMVFNNFFPIASPFYFIRASIIYIFSMTFPFFSFNTSIFYLVNLLENIKKMNYFDRYFICAILRSIKKYYFNNKKKCQFPELKLQTIANYSETIKEFLNTNSILPNEEIFLFLNKFLSNYDKVKENVNQNDSNGNYFIFKYGKIEDYVNAIKYDVVVKEKDSLFFKFKGKRMEYKFLTSDSIFPEIFSIYNEYYSHNDFNVEYFPVTKMIELIINLIYILLLPEYNEKSLALFLFKTIIVLNKLDDDLIEYKKNNEKKKSLRKSMMYSDLKNNSIDYSKDIDVNSFSCRTTDYLSENFSL